MWSPYSPKQFKKTVQSAQVFQVSSAQFVQLNYFFFQDNDKKKKVLITLTCRTLISLVVVSYLLMLKRVGGGGVLLVIREWVETHYHAAPGSE